ncbi:type II CRISPR-associated endonuclease Cas1 [Methylobacillus arboreus]|uniref:type II CRISPR-associated endonuclease Cas1 n=1 Tax=Methylobacillus arboreus TaxID=755170 RepID=UPI001E3063AD|nr:type II CRISPR-associated endonuclease Cas1 [Methylobacillus arboreus]MCB5191392.1 type II CRISPR-associated endonuclease Cas1 [Methylobacillus arboreus]
MVWRSVVISQPAKLKREHFSLVIEQQQSARIPFEDIAVIVLNNREITITHPVLSACGEYGIGLYSTGDNHQPNGVFLPFLSHSRATRMMRFQLSIDRPQAKRAWAEIVKVKIRNQAKCLKLLKRGDVERLESYANRVRSGDSENMEAQASSYYFPQIFGAGFHRAKDCWINAALDYGYAIIRGAVTRALVAHGFQPNIGLFHRSEQNAFNLADDLIEPYRALVDLHVFQNINPHALPEADLTPTDKVALVGLLNVDVQMPRGNMSVLSSIEQATESLVRLFDGANESALELPTLIGLRQHVFEM